MATAPQITANQQNAQSSTGPRTAEGKAIASQNAGTHGLTVSDDAIARQNAGEIDRLAASYAKQFPTNAPTGGHLQRMLACAAIRQRMLEDAQLRLLTSVEMDDPALARVERYRAAAERSFYRALKELQALVQNEANAPAKVEATPAPPRREPVRASHSHLRRNLIARKSMQEAGKLNRTESDCLL